MASNTAVEIGDKLHIITRRRFESDVRRHFVGELMGITGEFFRISGYTFVFTPGINTYKKLAELRTRIFSLGEEGFIVNVIPQEVTIASVEYRTTDNKLIVTDGGSFKLSINEFGATH